MTHEDFARLVLAFPGCEVGTSYGEPSFKLRGKFFTRVRSEDNSAVLPTADQFERDHLIEVNPDCFHLTPHYRNYPIVLARLDALDGCEAHRLLEVRWRAMVTKTMRLAYDARTGPAC